MMRLNRRKVFCIGFNKTGTSSLHEFFKACELKSAHNDQWPGYSHIESGQSYFTKQCYSDGEQSDFAILDKWFPRSLFILNDRSDKEWLYSRIKHVLRFNEQRIDLQTVLSSDRYGKMAKEFLADEEAAILKWISEKRIYTKQARAYFRGRKEFLDVDVTADKHWNQRILTFFETNGFLVSAPEAAGVIHQNRRNREDLSDQSLLNEYFRMVDGILATCRDRELRLPPVHHLLRPDSASL